MIVLDTSAALEYLADLEYGPWVASHVIADADLHAPHLFDIEVASALRRLVRERKLPLRRAEATIEALFDLPLVRHPHLPLLARIWGLRGNLHASDAAFVALAEALEAPLVTIDERLAHAPGLRITVVTPRATARD